MQQMLTISKPKITDWSNVNTSFVDSIEYYDTKKDLNLIKFKTPPKAKSLSKSQSNKSKSKSKSKSRSL